MAARLRPVGSAVMASGWRFAPSAPAVGSGWAAGTAAARSFHASAVVAARQPHDRREMWTALYVAYKRGVAQGNLPEPALAASLLDHPDFRTAYVTLNRIFSARFYDPTRTIASLAVEYLPHLNRAGAGANASTRTPRGSPTTDTQRYADEWVKVTAEQSTSGSNAPASPAPAAAQGEAIPLSTFLAALEASFKSRYETMHSRAERIRIERQRNQERAAAGLPPLPVQDIKYALYPNDHLDSSKARPDSSTVQAGERRGRRVRLMELARVRQGGESSAAAKDETDASKEASDASKDSASTPSPSSKAASASGTASSKNEEVASDIPETLAKGASPKDPLYLMGDPLGRSLLSMLYRADGAESSSRPCSPNGWMGYARLISDPALAPVARMLLNSIREAWARVAAMSPEQRASATMRDVFARVLSLKVDLAQCAMRKMREPIMVQLSGPIDVQLTKQLGAPQPGADENRNLWLDEESTKRASGAGTLQVESQADRWKKTLKPYRMERPEDPRGFWKERLGYDAERSTGPKRF